MGLMLEAIGKAAMLEQLAEEAAKLAQAALKLARIERGENPTPVSKEEAEENLREEYTDVYQCAMELEIPVDWRRRKSLRKMGKVMTVKELKAYLDKYTDVDAVSFIAVNPKNRIMWPDSQINSICVTDVPVPVIGFELHDSKPMDKEMIRAAEEDEQNSMWIPVAEKLPETADYVLMSFENFSLPAIGRYEVNDEGDGAWYLGNDDGGDTCCSVGLFVNSWMPVPDSYE